MLPSEKEGRNMPWQEQTEMSLKREFVRLASEPDANLSALCRRFGISRPTGYALLARHREAGEAGLAPRSTRPTSSPRRTDPDLEAAVVAIRDAHPRWGGRKIERVLQTQGVPNAPRASTCTDILRRHGRLAPPETQPHPWRRFEADRPNDLWQLDFKGHLPMATGRCHPLSVVDDHSRFALGLIACADERDATVRAHLTALFRRYGLPWAILTDNGPPWGNPHPDQRYTAFSFWLIRLGIAVRHGRPFHPQTQGKVERFHRTLKGELLGTAPLPDLPTAQRRFDRWRDGYNLDRPHEALGLATPSDRYRGHTPRPFPDDLPPIDYGPDAIVRKLHGKGQLSFRRAEYFVTGALVGQPVGLRPTAADGVFECYYCHHWLGRLDAHAETFTQAHAFDREAPMV
jgi:transposase InsO family protein